MEFFRSGCNFFFLFIYFFFYVCTSNQSLRRFRTLLNFTFSCNHQQENSSVFKCLLILLLFMLLHVIMYFWKQSETVSRPLKGKKVCVSENWNGRNQQCIKVHFSDRTFFFRTLLNHTHARAFHFVGNKFTCLQQHEAVEIFPLLLVFACVFSVFSFPKLSSLI